MKMKKHFFFNHENWIGVAAALKAKDGFKPSLMDLQSNTLSLCYLAIDLWFLFSKG